jgi:predicted RNA-binding Zn-ribbon protein involved in translation (DUF1610 family)
VLLAAGLLAWRQQRVEAEVQTIRQHVLCARCGHEDRLSGAEQRKLMTRADATPAIGPDFGEGLRCPSCGAASLYTKPVTCPKCSAKFLRSRNREFNTVDIKCPGCGWEG